MVWEHTQDTGSLVSMTALLSHTGEIISLAKICDTFPRANTLSLTHIHTHTRSGTSMCVARHTSLSQGDDTSCSVTELYECRHTHARTRAHASCMFLAEPLSLSLLHSKPQGNAAFRGHLLG